MGKKRTVRKRINKKKQNVVLSKAKVKKEEKKDVSKMTKLEYEQSMMDPRFRAAMMGFNNPTNNSQQYMNHALHEKEVKNNQLTQLINKEEELKKAKEEEIRLKDELAKTKAENKDKLRELESKTNTENLLREIDMIQKQAKYDQEMTALKTQMAAQKRDYENEQMRYKQAEELKQIQHDKMIQELNAKHNKEINDIKQITNDLARKSDIEKLEFSAAEQVANATVDKTKALINQELQEKIQPLQEGINEAKRATELTKTISEGNEKIKDAIKDAMIAEFKAATQPTLNDLQERNNELRRNMQLLDEKAKAIKNIKQAKLELDKAQIQEINQPILQQMNAKLQDLEGKMAINKDIYEEMRKQNEIKIKTAQLEQKIDPKEREEYFEKLKAQKLETHALERTNAMAEHLNKAFNESEALKTKIIENASVIFPEIPPEHLMTMGPELAEAFRKKEDEIRIQRAEHAKQLEQSERLLMETRKLEEQKIENEKAKAKLDVTYDESNKEFFSTIHAVTKQSAKLQQQTDYYNKMDEDLIGDVKGQREAISKFFGHANEYFADHPSVKARAEAIAKKKRGVNYNIITPEIITQAINEETIEAQKGSEFIQKSPNLLQQVETLRDEAARHKAEKDELQSRYNQQQELIHHMTPFVLATPRGEQFIQGIIDDQVEGSDIVRQSQSDFQEQQQSNGSEFLAT